MCEHIFTPNKSKAEPNPQPRNCTRQIWKDNRCAIHHPEHIAEVAAKKAARQQKWKEERASIEQWDSSKARSDLVAALVPAIIGAVWAKAATDATLNAIANDTVNLAIITADTMQKYLPGLRKEEETQ